MRANDTYIVRSLEALLARGLRFSCIYADPPWPYQNQASRGACANHYATMTLDDIAALPISDLCADNAHLHLWTTNAFLFESHAVMRAWGFDYKSCFIWAKPQLGVGNYWRVSHEILLLGVRGRCPFRDHSQRSWLEWPRTGHSEKPERIRELIERVSPGPRLELFARRIAPGWIGWGNAIERTLFDQEVLELT